MDGLICSIRCSGVLVSAGGVAGPFGAIVSLPILPNARIGDYRAYEVLGYGKCQP
jgi:hypothetical protein